MGGIGKAVKTIISGPDKIRPEIAQRDMFDISKEVKPAQEQYANLLAQTQANQSAVAPFQQQALTQMGMAATGQGPSLAEAQLKSAQDRGLAQQLAAAQASRAANPALAQRQLLLNMGNANRDLAQQAAIARLQERNDFMNQANVANQNLRTDIGGKLNLDIMPKQALQQWEQQRTGAVNQANQQNAANANALTGALLGTAGSALGGYFSKKAEGGPVEGPGTSTSDSIPTLLSDGEYVIKAKVAQQPGMAELLAKINAGSIKAATAKKIIEETQKKEPAHFGKVLEARRFRAKK